MRTEEFAWPPELYPTRGETLRSYPQRVASEELRVLLTERVEGLGVRMGGPAKPFRPHK